MPGVRVWVPLRGAMTIGMVVKVHIDKPTFKTRAVRRILDTKPVMDEQMLKLADWMHRFYYAGLGEVIQAALPSGLNFSSVRYLIPSDNKEEREKKIAGLYDRERAVAEAVISHGKYPLQDAYKRWGGSVQKIVSKLSKANIVEVWEEPEVRVKPKMELVWLENNENEAPPLLDEAEINKAKKWEIALDFLQKTDLLPANTATLTAFPEITAYTLNKLEKEGYLKKEEREVVTGEPTYLYDPDSIFPLNDEQTAVFEDIKQKIQGNVYHSFLLYGVTGSGKTEVYIHALREAMKMGNGGLILVPEIALTPQTVRRFYKIFGSQIAILHSRLNDRERYDAWQALRSGEKTIAIGARSAVFAPVKNLGLIIIDEEHDTSYRQADPAPRYHAREVAAMRAHWGNAVMVMGSATPSLVSLVNANRGKHTLLKLKKRHAGATMPAVRIIDLKQYRSAMKGPLAYPLYEAICEAVAGGEQTILLYNRRGFASYMQCGDCGHVVECPDCSVSMTYHKHLNQLRCHYCGFSTRAHDPCPACQSANMEHIGSGTQQVEEELETVLPDARILRMDQDTTSGKNAHDRILSAFGRGEADILVGTQLVAKGLDFPNVTVVGVINADTELAFPSYRSHERMYQLLSQVAGRSGRSLKKGRVFLQTRQADHFTLRFAREHDFEGFARHELTLRKPLLYPPYGRLLYVSFKGKDGQVTSQVAHIFTRILEQLNLGYAVLGPSPETIMRIKNEFRWITTMKLPAETKTRLVEFIADETFARYDKVKPKSASTVRITISHEMV